MNTAEIIQQIQRHYGLSEDGKAGPLTWAAIYNDIILRDPSIEPLDTANELTPADAVDERSEKNIATLNREVMPVARALIHEAAALGITIKVISGTRTYEEQNALYAKGRTAPGNIVTNARGGYSNHNFGIAFDIGVFKGDKYIPESPAYAAVGAIGKRLGLDWGGDWASLKDEPHFEKRPAWARGIPNKDMLARLRAEREA